MYAAPPLETPGSSCGAPTMAQFPLMASELPKRSEFDASGEVMVCVTDHTPATRRSAYTVPGKLAKTLLPPPTSARSPSAAADAPNSKVCVCGVGGDSRAVSLTKHVWPSACVARHAEIS